MFNSICLKIGCMSAREFESRSQVTNHRSNKKRDLLIKDLLLDFGLGEGGMHHRQHSSGLAYVGKCVN